MGKPQKIEVGDKFMLNCGIEVKVIENSGWDKILVTDEEGNEQVVKADPLRRGCVAFIKDGKKLVKKTEDKPEVIIKTGDIFQSENWGDVQVIEVLRNSRIIVEFLNTGYQSNVQRTALLSGQVRDATAYDFSVFKKIPAGSIFESEKYGKYEVIRVDGCGKVLIKWLNTGHEQFVKSERIRLNNLKDKSIKVKRKDYLEPKGYYVYVAKYNGDVYYVGFGTGVRYLHCNSGTSNSYKLNREHFNGVIFEIEIYKDSLSKECAENLEKEIINLLKPTCNIANTSHFRNEKPIVN